MYKYLQGEEINSGCYGIIYSIKKIVNPKHQITDIIDIKINDTTDESLILKYFKSDHLFKNNHITESQILKYLDDFNMPYFPKYEISGFFYLKEQQINWVRDSLSYGLIMEYIPGYDLRKIPEDLKANQVEMLKLYRQIFSAINFLHNHRIYHRDIKPENIMVTPDRRIKIIDFGLSYFPDNPYQSNRSGKNLSIRNVGTPLFFSPELMKSFTDSFMYQDNVYEPIPLNEDKVLKSDIWSIGATIFYMYTHKHHLYDLALKLNESRFKPPKFFLPNIKRSDTTHLDINIMWSLYFINDNYEVPKTGFNIIDQIISKCMIVNYELRYDSRRILNIINNYLDV